MQTLSQITKEFLIEAKDEDKMKLDKALMGLKLDFKITRLSTMLKAVQGAEADGDFRTMIKYLDIAEKEIKDLNNTIKKRTYKL